MPRFEFNNTLLFTDVLKKLGLEDLFETEDSLPRISDLPTHIDRIKQQCVIQVEEEGTEAVAVTMAEIHTGCLPPKSPQTRKTMRLDKPFAFAIKDEGRSILFMGVVNTLR